MGDKVVLYECKKILVVSLIFNLLMYVIEGYK